MAKFMIDSYIILTRQQSQRILNLLKTGTKTKTEDEKGPTALSCLHDEIRECRPNGKKKAKKTRSLGISLNPNRLFFA